MDGVPSLVGECTQSTGIWKERVGFLHNQALVELRNMIAGTLEDADTKQFVELCLDHDHERSPPPHPTHTPHPHLPPSPTLHTTSHLCLDHDHERRHSPTSPAHLFHTRGCQVPQPSTTVERCCISAAGGRLPWPPTVSRLYLGCISAVSRLYLGSISPVSRQYLACISAAGGRLPWPCSRTSSCWLTKAERTPTRASASHPKLNLSFVPDVSLSCSSRIAHMFLSPSVPVSSPHPPPPRPPPTHRRAI